MEVRGVESVTFLQEYEWLDIMTNPTPRNLIEVAILKYPCENK